MGLHQTKENHDFSRAYCQSGCYCLEFQQYLCQWLQRQEHPGQRYQGQGRLRSKNDGPQARGLRLEVVIRSATTGFRRKRQQTQHLERPLRQSCLQLDATHCSCQSIGLVASSAWALGFRRRNCRQNHPLLELHSGRRDKMSQRWVSSLQLDVREDLQ